MLLLAPTVGAGIIVVLFAANVLVVEFLFYIILLM